MWEGGYGEVVWGVRCGCDVGRVWKMGAGYGACEDRWCGNVGCVQEVSSHTLICYIDHLSTVHNIEVGYSRFSPVFVLVPWQDFSTLQININIYHAITKMSCTTECITNLRIDYSSNFSFTTWDVLRQMSGASLTASLGDIMLITIQKVIETPGTMLGAVQLEIHFSCPLESMTLPGIVISRIHFTTLCTSVMCNV